MGRRLSCPPTARYTLPEKSHGVSSTSKVNPALLLRRSSSLPFSAEAGVQKPPGKLLSRSNARLIPASPSILAVEDRKSTRLNSSHVRISYAVFCLKKKTK